MIEVFDRNNISSCQLSNLISEISHFLEKVSAFIFAFSWLYKNNKRNVMNHKIDTLSRMVSVTQVSHSVCSLKSNLGIYLS